MGELMKVGLLRLCCPLRRLNEWNEFNKAKVGERARHFFFFDEEMKERSEAGLVGLLVSLWVMGRAPPNAPKRKKKSRSKPTAQRE